VHGTGAAKEGQTRRRVRRPSILRSNSAWVNHVGRILLRPLSNSRCRLELRTSFRRSGMRISGSCIVSSPAGSLSGVINYQTMPLFAFNECSTWNVRGLWSDCPRTTRTRQFSPAPSSACRGDGWSISNTPVCLFHVEHFQLCRHVRISSPVSSSFSTKISAHFAIACCNSKTAHVISLQLWILPTTKWDA